LVNKKFPPFEKMADFYVDKLKLIVYNNTCVEKRIYAGVAELADALDLGGDTLVTKFNI
jgi:hypothetical protein